MDVFGDYTVEKLEEEKFPATPGEEYVLLDRSSGTVEQLLTSRVEDSRISSVEVYDAFLDEFFDDDVPRYGILEHAERSMADDVEVEYPSDLGLVENVERELENTYNCEL